MASTEQPELFDFDHTYPRTNITAPVAIFYGAVGTKCFKEMHVQLAEASNQVTYTCLFCGVLQGI
jgi:UDP-glucose:glycoprotein glucosyltransferase